MAAEKIPPNILTILRSNKTLNVPARNVLSRAEDLNEFLDQILKMLGDATTDDKTKEAITHVLQDVAPTLTLNTEETEFVILTLKNVYESTEKISIKGDLLNAMTLLLLLQPSGKETLSEVIDFFLLVAATAKSPLSSWACDCLLEIHNSLPEAFTAKLDDIFNDSRDRDLSIDQYYTLFLSSLLPKIGWSEIQQKVAGKIFENLVSLDPFVLLAVTSNLTQTLRNDTTNADFESAVSLLVNKYSNCYNACIMHSLALLLEFCTEEKDEKLIVNALVRCSIHSGLTVARNLLFLDWMTLLPVRIRDVDFVRQTEENLIPAPFDGADSLLKKLGATTNIINQSDKNSIIPIEIFEKLTSFALRNQSSRSLAAVFRGLVLFLRKPESCGNFTERFVKIIVDLAIKTANLMPHLVDFIGYLRSSNQSSFCADLIAKLVHNLSQLPLENLAKNLQKYLPFFCEATKECCADCQPRVIVNMVRRCLKLPGTSILEKDHEAAGILEFCQSLIKNQDIEIFLPELDDVMETMEKSHKNHEIRQRTWILRSLIANFPADELRSSLDFPSGVQRIGCLDETRETSFVLTLQDPVPKCVPYEIPLLIQATADLQEKYPVVYGLRIQLAVDGTWGVVESIYIPIFQTQQDYVTTLKIQPKIAAPVCIKYRCLFVTLDGTVKTSPVGELYVPVHQQLVPLKFQDNSRIMERSKYDIMEGSLPFTTLISVTGKRLLSDLERGKLSPFRVGVLCETGDPHSQWEAVFVTPTSQRIFTRIVPVNGDSLCVEAAVEDSHLLSTVYSLFREYL